MAAILRSLGAADDEIQEALAAGTGAPLALDLALREGAPLPVSEAAARIDVSEATLATVWQALGFPPLDPSARIPAAIVDALPAVVAGAGAFAGGQVTVGLLRVVGSTTARLAEALVDAFRVGFEVPRLAAGAGYSEVVDTAVGLAQEAMPAFDLVVRATLRAHLVRVAAGTWAADAEDAAARRQLFVGFADLSGYTALSSTLSARDLVELLERFEDAVSELVAGGDGRVVKMVGDGAMFVAESPEAGCGIALALIERLAGIEGMPPLRVGGAWGTVMSRYGDYFGDVVNLAARLVALAKPSTVVVDGAAAERCREAYDLERLPERAVKGLRTPPAISRVVGRRRPAAAG